MSPIQGYGVDRPCSRSTEGWSRHAGERATASQQTGVRIHTDAKPGDKLVIDKIEEIAKKRNIPMAQVALAWSLASPWVTAPIVGIKSTERLDELLEALELKLTEDEIESINSQYSPVKVRAHV